MTSYYLDGNAVSYLWDKYTKYTTTGRTGDDIVLSPFSETILSEYVVDEMLTIPIERASDAYKKHVAFLSIFPYIPVLKSITKFTKSDFDRNFTKELLMPREFAGQVAAMRALALVTPEHRKDLETDVENKNTGIEDAKKFLNRDSSGSVIYVNSNERIALKQAIAMIIDEQQLNPLSSSYDFHILCMNLFVATRNRLIRVPDMKIYKNEKSTLNSQIDFYHLSYLPYVYGFVTNDKYLNLVAKELVDYLNLDKVVYTSDEYWRYWLHKILSGSYK